MIMYVGLLATSAHAQFLWSERIASITSWPEGEPNAGLDLDANDIIVNGQNTVTNAISGTERFYRLSQ